jgi:hypothetical protein
MVLQGLRRAFCLLLLTACGTRTSGDEVEVTGIRVPPGFKVQLYAGDDLARHPFTHSGLTWSRGGVRSGICKDSG